MKVLIIEDEAPAFRRLQKILEEIDPSIEIVEVIDSVEDAVKYIRHHDLPDLLFMDIQLSDGISFDIFEQVTINKPVIFTTAFDEYTLRAFKVNSVDYLLKPIKKEELAVSIEKYRQLANAFSSTQVDISAILRSIKGEGKKYKSRFLVKQGEKLMTLDVGEIALFYLHHSVVHLLTWTGKRFMLDFTLDDLEQQLDPEQFFRANRQYLVHLKSILAAHKYHKGKLLLELKPDAGEQVIVSAEKAAEFKDWMGGV